MLSKHERARDFELSARELGVLRELRKLRKLRDRYRERERALERALERGRELRGSWNVLTYWLFKVRERASQSVSIQEVRDPDIDLTGGFVEFLLRVVMKHDDLDDQLNSLEEAYAIDVHRFGSKHPWWGILAARFHLYWWSLITFTKKGLAMTPVGKLVRSVSKKWGF